MFQKFLSRLMERPSLTGITVGLLFIFGILAYRNLQVDLFPPLNFPILNVITEIPSFSSLEMERQVTLPIESAVGGVLGVTKVRSTSATGISMVSAEFQWGTDMLVARQLLMESLSQIRGILPTGGEPVIENLSATLAMIEGYSLQSQDGDLVQLRDSAVYNLKPRLQRIPGVYKVIVMGGRVQEYAVYPNPFLLVKYDVTLDNLKDSLASNNILATPGTVNHSSQELVIHSNGQFASSEEIENVVITVKNGIPVRVKDLAHVREAVEYERGDTSENGIPTVLINIYKQPRFDTQEVAGKIAAEIAAFSAAGVKDYSIHNYYDQAELVGNSISSVKESVWIGAFLVVFILLLFLKDIRSTVIATLSIPISVITAIFLMGISGMGLNIMSLGGLAIGTGIIVDDAIVVLENIFRWLSTPALKKNLTHSQAVVAATREVVRPVVISTLTNIGIFLPMIFITGFSGRLFQPVSLTVTFALLASLAVALTVIPTLAAHFLSKINTHKNPKGSLISYYYEKLLQSALKFPRRFLLLGLLPVVVITFAFHALNVEFLPQLDEGALLLNTVMPPGASLGESKRVGLKLENWLKSMKSVQTVVRRTGHAPGAEDTDNVNHSDIMVKLAPKAERPMALDDFIDALKAKTSSLANVQVNYLMPLADKINDALGGVPSDIGIDLFGSDLDQLHKNADQILEKIKNIPGVSDLRPPSDFPVPSLEVNIKKEEAGRLGIQERAIYDAVQAYSTGVEATSVREVQKEIPVDLHFAPAGENLDMETLESLPLKTAGGSTVPLEQVSELKYGEVPSEIYHEHATRKLVITANVKGRNVDKVAEDIARVMDDLSFPAGYSWGFSGKYQSEQDALSNLALVLLLAILVVAIILWFEFQNLAQVGLILLTIPLAAVGAFISLWICHESLNVSSMIGAVMLVGIVVRNGIMLLDYMNLELQGGNTKIGAIRAAALKRARPILMTASVTVLGLFPIAVGWGTGSELLRPLAIAVIGGILTSTLLTLLVIPAASAAIGTKKLS